MVLVKEGLRIFGHCVRRKLFGPKKYSSNPAIACNQIINDCWNGDFFQASAGHFNEFYSRDIGWASEALIKLGFKNELEQTMVYALDKFEKANNITVAITRNGIPFNFPNVGSIDSIAYVFRTLRLLNQKDLVKTYKGFLQSQINFVASNFLSNGLIKKDLHLSSMKDYSIRQSSCYDNCFLVDLQKSINFFKLSDPFEKNLCKRVIDEFWSGSFFYDDLSKKDYVAGDANILPFWLGLCNDKNMFDSVVEQFHKFNLDNPFLLKYSNFKQKEIKINFLVPGWEVDSCWFSLGMMYLDCLKRHNLHDFCLKSSLGLVNKHQNVLEVFDNLGNPYKSLFYLSDEGMLSAAMLANHL